MEINREIKNITSAFVLEDNLTECVPYGSGHINDTYRLTYDTDGECQRCYCLAEEKDSGKRWRCGERDSESCDDKGWTSLLCR